MTTPRDLLPHWLVYHDISPSSDASCSISESCYNQDKPTACPPHISMITWDDGFTPSGCNNKPGKMIHSFPRSSPQLFQVIDHAVSEQTADLLYTSAVRAKVWGVYIPTTDLVFSDARDNNYKEKIIRLNNFGEYDQRDRAQEQKYREFLAKCAIQEFLVDQAPWISSQDWANTHGVAVWVIASDCDDETEYHLDYAEMVRYETNVIFPPIYGATLHVSPLRNSYDSHKQKKCDSNDKTQVFEGGGFHVNLRGLEHYGQYGYKTRLKNKITTDTLEAISYKEEAGWEHVSYKYRRGILCDGEFPHFSGRVRSLPVKKEDESSSSLAVKRAVVGFNLFPAEIGAFVHKFPEHSDAFNKYIKLSQTAVKQTQDTTKWSLASIRANPKQAAFLKFLAKKVKEYNVKEQTLRQQTVPHV